MSEVHHGDEFYFRQKKVAELREKGVEPYGEKYEVTHQAAAVIQNYAGLEDKSVSVSGRITSKRGHGKAAFAHIQDMSGKIQLYIRQDRVGEEEYNLYKNLDVGDIIGATGEVFKTKTGEITINISSL
jgi:lysyl-tRNA synthetase class 2